MCMREWMSGGQGHPVTREDAQSDGVLHLLPLVSSSLELPQLLSALTFNHLVHIRDTPVKPVAVFYNLLWIPTRPVTVSHYPACSPGL